MTQPHALIIDDNARNLNVLARLLADEGVTNTQVANAKRLDGVLDTLDQLNVIFLDIEMPGLSGYDVLQNLKADQRLTNVPVVAYTVHVSEINRAYQLGFDSFIGKPINPDKFPDQLASILRGEAVWATT